MNPTSKHARHLSAALALLVALWLPIASMAACPSWPTSDRFRFNTSGDEVTDNLTGLIWKRCSEGQVWLGIAASDCMGIPSSFTHEDALKRAQTLNTNASLNGWRLPSVKELFSLADRGCAIPAIDNMAFPNTLPNFYWSSSSDVYEPKNRVWSVSFRNGGVFPPLRSTSYLVRLVRSN